MGGVYLYPFSLPANKRTIIGLRESSISGRKVRLTCILETNWYSMRRSEARFERAANLRAQVATSATQILEEVGHQISKIAYYSQLALTSPTDPTERQTKHETPRPLEDHRCDVRVQSDLAYATAYMYSSCDM